MSRGKYVGAIIPAICIALTCCQSPSAIDADPTRKAYMSEFQKIDQAKLGRISFDQAVVYYRGKFKELDRDANGFLEGIELEFAMPDLNSSSPKELLAKFDRNGDGRLSVDEYLIFANGMFQLASRRDELTADDVENNTPGSSAPAGPKRDFGRPGGKAM